MSQLDNPNYYTKIISDSHYVLKAGDTMTGALTVPTLGIGGNNGSAIVNIGGAFTNTGDAYGLLCNPTLKSAASAAEIGLDFGPVFDLTNTPTAVIGLQVNMSKTGTGSVLQAVGVSVYDVVSIGTLNIALGISPGNFGGGPGTFSFYNASTYKSYFSANVGIGVISAATPLDVSGQGQFSGNVGINTTVSTNYGLLIGGTVTGTDPATGLGVNGIIQSSTGAGSSMYGINLGPTFKTTNSPGAVNVLQISAAINGASGTIGSSYAIRITNITGATNNYAIYSDHTGISYLSGKLGLGSGNVTPTQALDVSGSVKVSNQVSIGTNVASYPILRVGGTISPAGGSAEGIEIDATLTYLGNNDTVYGIVSAPTVATGTATGLTYEGTFITTPTKTGTGTFATIVGLNIGNLNLATATVQGIALQGISGGTTNNYGIYMAGPSSSAPGAYSIYASGSAQSYFAGNVGIGTTSPQAKLDIQGSMRTITSAQSANYQLTVSDSTIYATTGTTGITVTLPAASANTIGLYFFVYKVDAGIGALTIAASGTDTINGLSSKTIANQWNGVLLRGLTATSYIATSFTGL